MLSKIADVINDVREKAPLVQAITNYVTINDCANILLSFGASPAMCEAEVEVEEFVNLISSLYINTGTFTEEQERAALLATQKASELGKPIILDPVACGAISRKAVFTKELLKKSQVSVIKGNVGEIKFLAGYDGKVRGVDSIDTGEGVIEACVSLAKKYNTVVAATGQVDVVTDGERTCLIENGTPMLTLITGSGCMVGALTAATAGVNEDKFLTTVSGVLAMGLAGEMAANSLNGILPGTFRMKLFDYMYNIKYEDILKGGKIKCL
ncbi:MAG: hydroxyethylthiazole kinase [Peptococcales bacterium]|jgi:hydroxyethylthiazole kinase